MELTTEQWKRIEPIITELKPKKDPRGRPLRDPREILNGILWILRTGAPWKDMPQRYPPYQTCHRRFQQWVKQGVFHRIAKDLVEDLNERGKIDIREAFIDGSFMAGVGPREVIDMKRIIVDSAPENRPILSFSGAKMALLDRVNGESEAALYPRVHLAYPS